LGILCDQLDYSASSYPVCQKPTEREEKVYGFNSDTLEVMYVGSISGIVISFTILLSEIIGLDIQMGSTGFLFAIFTSFLIY